MVIFLPKDGLFEGGREIITTCLSCGELSSSITGLAKWKMRKRRKNSEGDDNLGTKFRSVAQSLTKD